MKEFDLLNIPLAGMNLIEASAGTGKTYNIAGLYLRLLLEKHLDVNQILVVTFTKAATGELQERIRDKLLAARRAIMTGICPDSAVLELLARLNSKAAAFDRIQESLQEFDSAAIFTIHGFCQRLLSDHAFEMGGRFDTELMTEPAGLISSVAYDFWRKNFYRAVPEFVQYILNKNRSPLFFQNLIEQVRHPGVRIIPDLDKPELTHLSEFRDRWSQLQSMWSGVRSEIEALLAYPGLNATVYGSLKPDKATPDRTVRQIRVVSMLQQMDQFISEDGPGLPLPDIFEKFTAIKIKSAIKKGRQPIAHPFLTTARP